MERILNYIDSVNDVDNHDKVDDAVKGSHQKKNCDETVRLTDSWGGHSLY